MRKTLFIALAILTLGLAGCSYGVYSVSSGKADLGAVCFTADSRYNIDVDVDGTSYKMETVKKKAYKSRRDIKRTSSEQIVLSPGRHKVQVAMNGKQIYNQEVFISATEVKIIEL